MIEGRIYKRGGNALFPFGEKTGVFTGLAQNGWPTFKLSGKKKCAVNERPECFIEIETVPPRNIVGDIYS